MHTIKRTLIAATAVTLLAGNAFAGLGPDTFDLDLSSSGTIGGLLGSATGSYTYGTDDAPFSIGELLFTVSSPTAHPDYDNAMTLDFTSFELPGLFLFGDPTVTTTLEVTGLDIDAAGGSVAVFLPSNLSNDVNLSGPNAAGDAFNVSWDVGGVLAANPFNPEVVVAWNTAPAPGVLALLGIAGCFGTRRRRTI